MPSLVWELVAKRLATAGFRVLIYDLYGRGYSEAPDALSTPYNTELYITQLALLMQAVGWRKARIVGLSMVSSTQFHFHHAVFLTYNIRVGELLQPLLPDSLG